MKLPKSVDKCDQPESRWLRLFNLVAFDLKEGVTSCQCCIFWRGFGFALLFFATPVWLATLGLWYLASAALGVQVLLAWIISSFFGDPK